jgi:ribosomal-protein-alanine N-acetyltransferase
MTNPLFDSVNIETKRLTIRPLHPTDAAQLHAVVSQPKVMKFLPEDVMTLEEVSHIIEWLQSCYHENTPAKIRKWTLAMVWKENLEVVGWCGLGPLDFNPSEVELFCGLSEPYWGRGIAVEACRALLDYAFFKIGLTRIVAVVSPQNHQSSRLVEKLGMRREKQVTGLASEFRHYEGSLYFSTVR